MRTNPAAKAYALSLFEVGQGHQKVERLGEELQSFAQLLKEVPEFQTFLISPSIEPLEKKQIVEKIFKRKADPLFLNLLTLLFKKGRFLLYPSIVIYYQNLMDKYLGILKVTCSTAVPLSELSTKNLVQLLEEKYKGKKIQITNEVHPPLLGGFILEFEGQQIDASLRHHLKNFHYLLMEQSSQVRHL